MSESDASMSIDENQYQVDAEAIPDRVLFPLEITNLNRLLDHNFQSEPVISEGDTLHDILNGWGVLTGYQSDGSELEGEYEGITGYPLKLNPWTPPATPREVTRPENPTGRGYQTRRGLSCPLFD